MGFALAAYYSNDPGRMIESIEKPGD
ncbi:hypothetical protein AGR4B_pAt20093 [Agrobacterium tumefaciens str. CFBP 5621]|nr:hypothetical protein AGR4B_pAt20093 [Agrobacterium tumefaciens str. CFBP 5621]